MRKGKLVGRVSKKLFSIKKLVKQYFMPYAQKKVIIYIVGCQRSGTSMLYDVFNNDINTKAYGEKSKLSSLDRIKKIRINPLNLVKKEISKVKPSFIVLKPLVESQNILKLLEYFEGSKAIWMYRNYQDVASSSIKKFGINTGINDLRPIVENDQRNWRAEKTSKEVREIILEYFSESMNPYDAAVLFWYARNRLYFELELDKNKDVILCKYEKLVASSSEVIETIYKRLGQNFPSKKICKEIDSTSLGKGKNIKISPEIAELANELMKKLDTSYQSAPLTH